MKKLFNRLIIFLLISVTITGCNNVKKEKNVIKIGAILPLTGKWALIGESEQVGLKLALDSLEKAHPKQKIELIIEDFNSEIKNAVSAANKLSSVDNVDAIITSTTAAAEAVSSVITRNHIIHFVITPDLQIVDRSKFNFRIYYNFKTEGQKINEFLNYVKAKNVSFLGMKYSAIQREINDVIIPYMKKESIQLVDTIYFDTKANDFKTQIIKVKKQNPNVLYLIPHVDQVENLSRQLKEYNVKPTEEFNLIYSYTFNWSNTLDLNNCEDFYVCTPVFQISNEKIDAIQKKLINNHITANFDMMFAFDNLMILTNLLIKSDKNYEKFLNEFNNLGNYSGASGKIKFIGNRDTDVDVVITQVKNGKLIKLF